jgi:hypothetical protein
MDCYCDYDPPEFYNQSIRKARKPHKCAECSGAILPGEKYEYVFGKWDGYTDTHHTCERCYDMRQWVKNNVPCHCVVHGNQDEENMNAITEARYRARDETRGLLFGYLRRKYLRNKINDERRKLKAA